MRTLPYDFCRCDAEQPDSHCKNCLRWADLPGQTWGDRTPMVEAKNSSDDVCDYIPITKEPNGIATR